MQNYSRVTDEEMEKRAKMAFAGSHAAIGGYGDSRIAANDGPPMREALSIVTERANQVLGSLQMLKVVRERLGGMVHGRRDNPDGRVAANPAPEMGTLMELVNKMNAINDGLMDEIKQLDSLIGNG